MALTTLLDIAKSNGSDAVVGLIDETSKAHPEITKIAARTIKGLVYKTWVRVGLPSVGFRNANEGSTPSVSKYENRLVDTYGFNPRWECDKMVADAHEDGAEFYIATEADAVMEASMQLLSRQFYYGRHQWQIGGVGPDGTSGTFFGGDAKGFPGLIDGYNRTLYEVDGGGTTDNTATSVWAVKFGEKFTQWVWGGEGQLAMSDVMLQRCTDANGRPFTAYVQEILARPGLQFGSLRGVGRIKKITDDTAGKLTDAKLAQLISQFEVGVVPDLILMNRRARRQLQQSRTVTLFGNQSAKITGANATLAPLPTSYDEIPIAVTDSISDTEAFSL